MFFQSVKMAWHAVTVNKLRTFLTMLGIIIGVTALIVLVSIADGATSSVKDEISGMGSSYLTVSITDDKENPLRLSEMSDFSEPEEIEAAAPVSRTSVTAKNGYTSDTMTLIGTTGSYAQIQNMELAYGRFIMNADVENHTYVTVLTYDTAVELLGRADVTGESVSLNGKSFLVIGVLSEESSSSLTGGNMLSSSSDEDSETTVNLEGYIPFSTMTRMADNILAVTQFYVSAADSETLDYAETALTDLLMNRFENDEDAFSVTDQSRIMDTMESVDNTMSLMIGGIAAISLLVGGIGAKKGMIMLQFLLEAMIVSLMGCMAGIGISWVILKAAGFFTESIQFVMDMRVVWISVIFSTLIGIGFGLYPAGKAAAKNPIEALRYTG